MTTDSFDYVIVGAGSAGCVLANRLSEDGKFTVAVLEAGGDDSSVFIQMPTALSIPMGMDKYNWGYHTEPEPHLDGRRMDLPRGKVIGGGSSINGMVYIRGNAMDYEGWEALGAKGWGYRNVLPYFRKAETRNEGGDAYRGESGPLHTSYGPMKNPLYSVFVEAAKQAGYAATDDVNGATKIEFEGKRAVAIRYLRGGIEHMVRARREIILAGGPINSPQLLKLSGIGQAEELKAHGITPLHHLPGVGENLQDHLEFYFQQACTKPITLYSSMNFFAKALIGARWILFKNGLGATNHFESCGFIRSRPGVPYADIQYHFLPAAIAYDGSVKAEVHGFQAHVGPMRSKSRGWVRLASSNPLEAPKVLFNYMSHEEDRIEMRACVRLTREIFGQEAFAPYRGEEMQPGSDVVTDEQIDAFARRKVESAYHPCGTCKMGDISDPMAVVDTDTRVIGLEGLRVVDTSIMPRITTGNLNAPAIMIGEKASDAILGRTPLPASNAPFYHAQAWETRQR